MKVEVNLLQLRPNIIFQVLVPDFSLEHEPTGEKGEHFVIVAAYAAHLDLLLRQVESALSSVTTLLKSEKSEMLAADHEPFGPVAQTYACLFDFLHNSSLVVDNESGRIGENCDVWWRAEVVMRQESVFLCQICQAFIFVLFYHEWFFLNVLFQFEHLERLLSQHAHHWIFWVGIEQDIVVILLFSSGELDLRLASHALGVPEGEHCLPVWIFAGDWSEVFRVAAPGEGNAHPGMKGELSGILQSFFLGGGVELVIEYAGLLCGLEAHGHCLFVVANGNAGDLGVPLGAGVVGLRFLFLSGVVDDALVAGYVEEAVGGE